MSTLAEEPVVQQRETDKEEEEQEEPTLDTTDITEESTTPEDGEQEPSEEVEEEVSGGVSSYVSGHSEDKEGEQESGGAVATMLRTALLQALTGFCNDDDDNDGMLAVVLRFLLGRNYELSPPNLEGRRIITMAMTGKHATYRTFIDLKIPQDRMSVICLSPVKVFVHARSAVIEFLMRVNYSLALGSFELDMDDGEVRYRLAIDIEGSVLSEKMVENNVMVSSSAMDRSFPGIMAVMFGTQSPAQAFADCLEAYQHQQDQQQQQQQQQSQSS